MTEETVGGGRIALELWQITATKRSAAAIKAEKAKSTTNQETTTGIESREAKDVIGGEASTPQTKTTSKKKGE